MDQELWNLHVDVVELARASGLDRYRVDTKTHASGVLLELTCCGRLPPAYDEGGAPPPPSRIPPVGAMAPDGVPEPYVPESHSLAGKRERISPIQRLSRFGSLANTLPESIEVIARRKNGCCGSAKR
jgi:hypothetical protein